MSSRLFIRSLFLGMLLSAPLVSSPPAGHAAPRADSPTVLPAPPALLPGAVPTPCHRTNAINTRRFAETGQALGGDFLNYWEKHGALPDQGYPISPVLTEVSDLNGKTYQVQYFERAVFECHPENAGTVFTILLSQLGTFQYRSKYPQGAPGQRPNGENPRLFAETGHTLGGEFRTYWETHGGKAQNGLPLSDEFTEISDLDGKPYTVQYFERAVFEFHPENQRPYRVLLSQLGTFRYRAKYPTPPPATAVGPLPSDPPTGPQFLGYLSPGATMCLDQGEQVPLRASGSYLLWQDATTQATVAYDGAAHRQLRPAQPWNLSTAVRSDGHTLTWFDATTDPPRGGGRLRSADPTTGQERATTLLPQVPWQWAAGDQTLYWLQDPTGTLGDFRTLVAYDGRTGQTTRFAAPAGIYFDHLVAGSGYIAWEAVQWTGSYSYSPGPAQIYVLSAQNPTVPTILPAGASGLPIISGDHLFWMHPVLQPNGNYNWDTDIEVRMYTFSTHQTRVLARGGARRLSAAGDRVAWFQYTAINRGGGHWAEGYPIVLDVQTGAQHTYTLPEGTTDCVALAGDSLAYVRDLGLAKGQMEMLPELYLQPLP